MAIVFRTDKDALKKAMTWYSEFKYRKICVQDGSHIYHMNYFLSRFAEVETLLKLAQQTWRDCDE